MNSMSGFNPLMGMRSKQGFGGGASNPAINAIDKMLKKRGMSKEQFAHQIGEQSKLRLGEEEESIPGGYREYKLNQFTPQQMELYDQLFQYLGPDSYLARLASGDESLFEEMEAPALRQFSELQGNIANRFSGAGMGGRRSSGFYNTMGKASSDFAQELASRRNQLRHQAIQDLMGMSHTLLGERPFEKGLIPKYQKPSREGGGSSGWEQLLGPLLKGLLTIGATAAAGPAGGAAATAATSLPELYNV